MAKQLTYCVCQGFNTSCYLILTVDNTVPILQSVHWLQSKTTWAVSGYSLICSTTSLLGDTKIVVILYMRQIHTFTLSTSSNRLNYNPSLKKFYHFLCYKNGILRGLGKSRGYLGCPQAKAKLNFASQKMEQDSVMARKKEEQIQDWKLRKQLWIGVTLEGGLLFCCHWGGGGLLNIASFFLFWSFCHPPAAPSPAVILPVYIPLKE